MSLPPPNRASPAARAHAPVRDSWLIHPLDALDGVLLCVSKNGETVGFYFGRTADLAADALAADVVPAIAYRQRGDSA
jgi:hypothetical protein